MKWSWIEYLRTSSFYLHVNYANCSLCVDIIRLYILNAKSGQYLTHSLSHHNFELWPVSKQIQHCNLHSGNSSQIASSDIWSVPYLIQQKPYWSWLHGTLLSLLADNRTRLVAQVGCDTIAMAFYKIFIRHYINEKSTSYLSQFCLWDLVILKLI